MKKIIILFFFLSACTYNSDNQNFDVSKMSFSDDLSFEEFKQKLEKYANNSPYPNIDN